ncbi:hypothetical protein PV326_004991 [Microctonus aethiopoides]|nr:hypothetical protein PV326_004991 [Microctonus aethiopoides]
MEDTGIRKLTDGISNSLSCRRKLAWVGPLTITLEIVFDRITKSTRYSIWPVNNSATDVKASYSVEEPV